MKKTLSLLLIIAGALFLVVGLICVWVTLNAYIERSQHGVGIMFADAEIFLVLMLFFLIAGIFCFWIEKKLYDPKK